MAAIRCRGNTKPVLQLSYIRICGSFCRSCWLYHLTKVLCHRHKASLLRLRFTLEAIASQVCSKRAIWFVWQELSKPALKAGYSARHKVLAS